MSRENMRANWNRVSIEEQITKAIQDAMARGEPTVTIPVSWLPCEQPMTRGHRLQCNALHEGARCLRTANSSGYCSAHDPRKAQDATGTRDNGPPLVSIPLAEHQLLVKTYKQAVAREMAVTNALHSAALTVEWLKQLLTVHHRKTLPASERIAFAQLLNDMGVLDDGGFLYVRIGVESELAALATPAITGICAHRFDSTVCVAPAHHDGPHVTSNAAFPHGLAYGTSGPSQEGVSGLPERPAGAPRRQ